MCSWRPLALLISLLTCVAATASGSIIAGPFVNPQNGYSYYLIGTATWTASEADAQLMGGNLATINNSTENAWIFSTFGPTAAALKGDLWIGLRDPVTGDWTGATHAADFVWADGSTASYRDWKTGQPDNDPNNGGEYYADITGYSHNQLNPSQWNDKNNEGSANAAYGIVEVVPEPATLGLLLFTMTGVFLRRNSITPGR